MEDIVSQLKSLDVILRTKGDRRVLSRGLVYSVFSVHGKQSNISLGRQLNHGEARAGKKLSPSLSPPGDKLWLLGH